MRYFGKDEKMDQDSSGEHPFLSYAKQVSFPRWNVMVGEMGEKFTRRSSIEKEKIEQHQETEHETEKLQSRKNMNFSQASQPHSEQRVDFFSSVTQASACHTAYEGENSHRQAKRSISDNSDVERKQIFRYCEIIKEESRESDEEIVDNKENEAKPYISTVNITLKHNRSPPQIEVRPSTANYGHDGLNHNNSDGAANNKTNKYEMFTESHVTEDNNSKPDIRLISLDEQRPRRINRAAAIDENHLAPQAESVQTEHTHKSHKQAKGRFRKKSSSFSGALPLRVSTTQDEHETAEVAPHSPVASARHAAVRRRGTIDMGSIEMPKSPRINGGRPKKTDPSHYLMQNMGKRRGSYNPTYDQSNLKMNKTKKNHMRAKSMHIVHTEDHHSLRERLMQHACPELRESLELDTSENESEVDRASKEKKERHDCQKKNRNKQLENVSSSELTRRKISLAKSASFNSFAALGNSNDKKKDENVTNNNERYLTNRLPSNEPAAIRKTPVIRNSSSEKVGKIDENRNMNLSASDNEQKHDQGQYFRNGRSQTSRARNVRAQSSFDGVSPTYLGRLRQKSFEHRVLDRAKSDSMSSVSSSEGSEIIDPFPMHYAAKFGKTKQLQKIISSGKNVNVLDANGWPPIHYALTAGKFDCVACLLNAGANITDYAKGRTSKYFR